MKITKRRAKRAVTAYVKAARAVLPATWNDASDDHLVMIGSYLVALAHADHDGEALSDGLAIGTEFAERQDLAVLFTIAHAHLGPLLLEDDGR